LNGHGFSRAANRLSQVVILRRALARRRICGSDQPQVSSLTDWRGAMDVPVKGRGFSRAVKGLQ